MNLNKLLCKHLDRDGKGYVTIGNVVTTSSMLGTVLIIVMSYVRGVTTIMEHLNGDVLGALDSSLSAAGIIDAMCIPFAIVGTGLALAIILSFVLARLWIAVDDVWGAKIAKCERKEGDEQHG